MGLLFFVAILGFAMLAATIFPKIKPGTALFSSTLFMMSLSYIVVILLGVYRLFPYLLIYGGALLAVGLLIYGIVKKKVPIVTSYEFGIFAVLSAVLVMLLGDGVFIAHDNYSFWARAVRELYLFKDFYINSSSNIAHADYNPVMASLQYCIVAATGWKDASLFYVIIAAVSASITCIAGTFTGKNRKIWQTLFAAVCIILLPFFSNTFATSFLGADTTLALFFLTGIILYFYREDNSIYSFIPLFLLAFILPAVKLYSGLLFAVCLIGGVFIDRLLSEGKKEPDVKWWKKTWWRYPAVLLACIMLMQLSWSFAYNYNNAVAAAENRIARENFAQNIDAAPDADVPFSLMYFIKGNPRNSQMVNEVVSGNLQDTLRETFYTMQTACKHIFTVQLGGSSFTLVDVVFLLAILFAAICLFDKNLKTRRVEMLTLLSGALIYTIGVFATYFVQPGTLSGIIRYSSIAIICLTFYVLMLLMQRASADSENENGINPFKVIGLVVLAFIVINVNINTSIESYTANEDDEFISVADMKDYVNDLLIPAADLDENDRILIVDAMDWNDWSENGLNSFAIYYYIYEFLPARAAVYSAFDADYSNIDAALMDKINELVLYNRDEYVLITSNDTKYISAFHEYFSVPEDAVLPWLFKTSVVDGAVQYEYVGGTTAENNTETNLLLGLEEYSTEWTVSGQNNYSYVKIPVESGKTYELAADSISLIEGSAAMVDVRLYDTKNDTSLYDCYLPISELTGSQIVFSTPENMNEDNVSLLLYVGEFGETGGNTLLFEDLTLCEVN